MSQLEAAVQAHLNAFEVAVQFQLLCKVWKKLLLLRMFLRNNNRQEPVRWFKEHEIP